MRLTVCTLEGSVGQADRVCALFATNVGRRAISSTSTRSLLLTVNRGNTTHIWVFMTGKDRRWDETIAHISRCPWK